MGDNLSNLACGDAFWEWLNSDENRYESNIYYDQFVLYLENKAIDKNLISDICTSIIDFGKWHNNSKSELFAQDLDQCSQIEGKLWISLPEVPRCDFLRYRRAVEYYSDFLIDFKKIENRIALSEAVPDNI